MIIKICMVCLVICMAGCSSNLYVKAERPPVVQSSQEVIKRPPGTIWPGENAMNSLFIDRKARRVNDIITIVVSESAVGGNNASTDTGRDTSTSAGITSLLGLEQSILQRNANMGTSVSVGGTSSNSLKGTGKTTRDGNLTATISAKVINILENGNFIIEGRRQLTINAEDQYLIITGIIRPDDITSDNTVLSQYIADAKIVYAGRGVVDDKMRPGWLTRIVDWVWPF
ncbi:MAG TPA: flagellar basal body L-ring protein FlgH [Thermodesulfovibrionales bacterium]|nr:flagellar basal body L-ring protein FlgH [Thermodesulfovibrionales bacterium]